MIIPRTFTIQSGTDVHRRSVQMQDQRQHRNSATTSNIDEEVAKLHYAVKYGADTLMDLSTGGDIPRIRKAIMLNSPIPIGTVPIYEALTRVRGWRISNQRDAGSD